ncbi:MAG: hypothetical protein D3X82_13870 [Candidatus Leucobacter sulfamidivorax]|nr:hypothetical protein [Candidatus Leucobacter sulfamidivorax]
MATKLRAVGPDEKPPVPPAKTIVQAIEQDDVIAELRNTRLVIAKKLDDPNCSGRDMAALSKRLREIGREIEAELMKQHEEATDASDAADEAFDAQAI